MSWFNVYRDNATLRVKVAQLEYLLSASNKNTAKAMSLLEKFHLEIQQLKEALKGSKE